jgi:GNAT superfamily N-acetyltransferase
MEIRLARDEELDDVSTLLGRAYAQYEQALPSPGAWAEYSATVADVRGRSGESQLWVAELDGALAGSLDYYPPGDSPYHRFVGFPSSWAAFRFLGTDPDRRGSGVGRALVERAIALARSEDATHLGLHSGQFMKAAVRLYGHLGFERSPEHDFSPVPDANVRVLGFALAL